MSFDICDATISLRDQDDLDDWNAMILAFLSHGKATPQHLGAVLERNPGFAMGHAAKGLFSLMLGRSEMVAAAQEAARVARSCAEGISARERLWVVALESWLDGYPSRASDAMEKALAIQPRDTLSAKVSHAILFILGDARGMRQSIENVLEAHKFHPLRGYILGCHAFTLEETGEYDAAEQAGLEALIHAPDDAWGLHAVAHVYDMTARPDQGITLIESHPGAWDHCNNFRYHVWWHKALLHLDRGDVDEALALYDTQIRADKTDDYRDISNATSLLTRLELEGRDVGARWDELADISERRIDDGCVVFADLHYALALCAAGKTDARNDMRQRYITQARAPQEMAQRIADPGKAALAGLEAFSEGRYNAAFANLLSARPAMQSIGGSHAQRDVFERITIDAGLRAGQVDAVEAVLNDRTARRAGNRDRFATSRYAALADARQIPAQ